MAGPSAHHSKIFRRFDSPVPKSSAHMRLTVTRAVRGLEFADRPLRQSAAVQWRTGRQGRQKSGERPAVRVRSGNQMHRGEEHPA